MVNILGFGGRQQEEQAPDSLAKVLEDCPRSFGRYVSKSLDEQSRESVVPVLYFDNMSADTVAVDLKTNVNRTTDGRILERHVGYLTRILPKLSEASIEVPQVVLVVNSPGGAVTDFTGPYHALCHLREQLKRYFPGAELVVLGDRVIASGGYMLAASADKILVPEGCIIGSIGVVATAPNFFEVLKRVGVQIDVVTAGTNKRSLHSYVDPENKADALNQYKEELGRIHDYFKYIVKKQRAGISDEAMDGSAMLAYTARQPGQEQFAQLFDEYIDSFDAYLYALRASNNLLHFGTTEDKGPLAFARGVFSSMRTLVRAASQSGPQFEFSAPGFQRWSGK